METYRELKNKFDLIMDFGDDNPESPGYIAQVRKNLEDLSNDLTECVNLLRQKRTALFFPKAVSKSKEVNELGLLEEQTATQFLSTPQTSDQIINRLNNNLELGKIDSASYIFQKLIPQIPKSESELSRLQKDKLEFFETLKSIYKKFTNRQGIDFFDNELSLIDGLEKKITQLKRSIN